MRFDAYICEERTPRSRKRYLAAYITYRDNDKGVLIDLFETKKRWSRQTSTTDMARLAAVEIMAYCRRNGLPAPTVQDTWYHWRPACHTEPTSSLVEPPRATPLLLRA